MFDFFGLFRKQEKVPLGSIWCYSSDTDNPFMADPSSGLSCPLFKVLAVSGDWVKFQRGLGDDSRVDSMRLTNWLLIFEPVPKSWKVQ